MTIVAVSVAAGVTRGKGDELEERVRGRIEDVMTARAMRPSELARRSGISESMLNHLLQGRRTIALKYLDAIASALGMNPADFFPEDGREPVSLATLERHLGRSYVQTMNMLWDLQRQAGTTPGLAPQVGEQGPTPPVDPALVAEAAREFRAEAQRAERASEAGDKGSAETRAGRRGAAPQRRSSGEDRPRRSPRK